MHRALDWRSIMYILSAVIECGRSKVALFDKDYKLLSEKCGTCAEISELCSNVMADNGISCGDVEYLGVAVDASFGNPVDTAAEIEKNSGIKCYGASIISARALGEAYISNDVPYLTLLKIDEDIECGLVIDKKVYAGVHQEGGKIGNMIINYGGFECECGRRGCFKAYASNSGLKRIASDAGVANADSITHKELFAMNTPEAEKAKETYLKFLSSGITNVINLFQPNELVLEGPFTEVGEALDAPMMETLLRDQYTHSAPNKCNIRVSVKDTDTALLGASLLGR